MYVGSVKDVSIISCEEVEQSIIIVWLLIVSQLIENDLFKDERTFMIGNEVDSLLRIDVISWCSFFLR